MKDMKGVIFWFKIVWWYTICFIFFIAQPYLFNVSLIQEVIDEYMASCRRKPTSTNDTDADDERFDVPGEDISAQEFADFQRWLEEVNPPPSSGAPPASIPVPAPAATPLCSKCNKDVCKCSSSKLQVSILWGIILILVSRSPNLEWQGMHIAATPFLSQPLFAKVLKMLNVLSVFGRRFWRSWLWWRRLKLSGLSLDWWWISDKLVNGSFDGHGQFSVGLGCQWKIKTSYL